MKDLSGNLNNAADIRELSTEIIRSAFDRSPDPSLIFDPLTGLIIRSNKATSNLFNLPQNLILGRTIGQLYPDEEGILHLLTEEALVKGFSRSRELHLSKPDGKPLRLEHTAIASTWQDKTCIQLSIIDLDAFNRRTMDDEANRYQKDGLDEWKKAERYFREIERENQLILAAAGEGIYGVNVDGITTFVNPAAEEMLGFKASELVGKDMHTVIHHHKANGTHYPHEDCPIYNAFRQGTIKTVDDEVFWAKNNKPIRVEYTSTPIRDAGAVVGAVIVFRDITKRKQDEEKLKSTLEDNAKLRKRLEMENAYLQEEIRSHTNHYNILGHSDAINKILEQIELVAPTDANVLITGESGTGKELVARAIHNVSERRDRPLIRVNCAAIPRELFESEFFGHIKGAFTGAVRDRIGRFELANGGTLFLDEVGEIPLDLQSKLLRVLQDQRFERVGEDKTRTVDVRIIAATNRDLKEDCTKGKFREDLYFRLNVVPIECTPLRERLNDLPILADHFLKSICDGINKEQLELTKANIESLKSYSWPGNARELQNVLERAAILAVNGKLRFDFPNPIEQKKQPSQSTPLTSDNQEILTSKEMYNFEKSNIERALIQCDGRVSGKKGAAEKLGMKPTTLYSRLKAMKININDFSKTMSQ